MNCPYCGNKLNDSYCFKCAKKIYTPGRENEAELILPKKKKSGGKSAFLLLILIMFFVAASLFTMYKLSNEKIENNKKVEPNLENKIILSEYNNPKYLEAKLKTKIRKESDIYYLLEELKETYKFNTINDEFDINTYKVENLTHFRLNQKYKEIPVLGQTLVVTVDNKTGTVLTVTGEYIPEINDSILGSLTEKEILNKFKEIKKADETVIDKQRVIANYQNVLMDLYIIKTETKDETAKYLISTKTGEMLKKETNIEENISHKYTSETINGEKVTIDLEKYQIEDGTLKYKFFDNNRKIHIKDLNDETITGVIENGEFIYKENTDENKDYIKRSVSLMKNLTEIYDYYDDILNFNLNEESITVKLDTNLTNPYYFNKELFIDKSSVILKDIIAHEFTHQVIESTANLGSSLKYIDSNTPNENGALKESYADILASLIEGKDWIIGNGLRDLSNPTKNKLPKIKNGEYYYPSIKNTSLNDFLQSNNINTLYEIDKGGIHTNSTVVSYAAYLMWTNETFTKKEEMAKIWFNSLYMLTPTSNFEDCALAVIKTAENLGLQKEKIEKIENAFYDTNILNSVDLTLTGNITYKENPITNAKITLENIREEDEKYITGSNKEGDFSFDNIKRGEYILTITKDGYKEVTRNIKIIETTSTSITLEKTNEKETKDELTIKLLDKEFKVEKGIIITEDNINKIFNGVIKYKNNELYIAKDNQEILIEIIDKDTKDKLNLENPITKNLELEIKIKE